MSAEEATLLTATATTTTQQQQQQSDDLPRAHIKRIMKHQLSKFSHVDPKNNQPFEPNIAKDALDGVQQACKIFIHYLTSTANDICTESKRSTLSAVSDYCDYYYCLSLFLCVQAQARAHISLLSLSSLCIFEKFPQTAKRAHHKLGQHARDANLKYSPQFYSLSLSLSLTKQKTRTTSSARCVKSISTSSSRS
jgi:histone H3/H4